MAEETPVVETQTTTTPDPAAVAAQAAEEAKTTDLQKSAVEAYKAEQAKSVPEAYKFELPEGRALDAKAIELAAPVFKELGLSQEAASKVVGIHAQLMQASEEALQTQIAEQNAAWVKESKDAKDINTEVAQKAMGKFGTPKLTQYLKESGLGNHPELLRAFTKIGLAIKEDTVVGGSGEATVTPLERIYNHPTSKVS